MKGAITGYAATSAKATGDKRLNTNSKSAKKYQKLLVRKQKEVLDQAAATFGRSLTTTYAYQHAINGFTVELTASEAKALGHMAGVVAVQKERDEHLLTDVGPAWIGAPDLWSNGGNSTQGEGMVVAVLDSGINSDHPSFAGIGGDGYNHTNPLGSGNYLPGSHCNVVDPTFCKNKLIGAWDMTEPADGSTPEDTDGHGSHTASTAAGNVVLGDVSCAHCISFI
jgi:subtilisin family serine protease